MVAVLRFSSNGLEDASTSEYPSPLELSSLFDAKMELSSITAPLDDSFSNLRFAFLTSGWISFGSGSIISSSSARAPSLDLPFFCCFKYFFMAASSPILWTAVEISNASLIAMAAGEYKVGFCFDK
ncbi:hypothetical protein OGATHE_005291 [Ogataea polymorpha]|uniref:Uncharacterized protein n=1 Tax=Ogataea polymorpha TaxID=460523 RepID=A0A9P8NXN1_9ASCO|nr:hypothetical protein OGATHE_005291 [Ogataea polymorpha]